MLPDGSDAGEATQWLARHAAEAELAAAEEAVAQGLPVRGVERGVGGWVREAGGGWRGQLASWAYGSPGQLDRCPWQLPSAIASLPPNLPSTPIRYFPVQGAAKKLKAAERKLDAVLEAALGDDFDAIDDFDALEAPPLLPTRPASEQRNWEICVLVPFPCQLPGWWADGMATPPTTRPSAVSTPPRPALPAAAGDPESFSRVDLSLSDAALKKKFPLFPVSALGGGGWCCC